MAKQPIPFNKGKMIAMMHRAKKGKNLKAIRKEFRMEMVRLEMRALQHGIPHSGVPRDLIENPKAVIGNICACLQQIETMLDHATEMDEEADLIYNQNIDDLMLCSYVLRHCMGIARVNAKKPKIDLVTSGVISKHVVGNAPPSALQQREPEKQEEPDPDKIKQLIPTIDGSSLTPPEEEDKLKGDDS